MENTKNALKHLQLALQNLKTNMPEEVSEEGDKALLEVLDEALVEDLLTVAEGLAKVLHRKDCSTCRKVAYDEDGFEQVLREKIIGSMPDEILQAMRPVGEA